MEELGPFLAAFVVFGLAGGLVLTLADADADREGGLQARTAIALWLLAFFHANTVVSAAFTDVLRLDGLPRVPFLVLGLAISAGGWIVFIVATAQLVRRGAFVGLETTKLVTTGLFARTRHPQSLGWTLLLLGVAVASRSVLGLVLVAVFALFAARYAKLEERGLRDRFGAAYDRYRTGDGSGTSGGRRAGRAATTA
jgi:protein-S-isoprenylcysteine O-methyltransferase Ste14